MVALDIPRFSQTMSAPDAGSTQLEVLNEVARIATLDLELRPMLHRITDTLARKFDWQFVALIAVEAERDAFICEALTTSVPTIVHVGYSRPLGSGVVGQVAKTSRPIVIDDVTTYPGYIDTLPGAKSEICVPVTHRGSLVAVLNVESTRPAAFHGQLPLLLTVADQIAGAIASARLYAELQKRARLMELMSEVSRTSLEATDRGELLHRIARYIHDRFPLELTAILLYDPVRDEFVQTVSAGSTAVSQSQRWSIQEGVVGRCIRTGQTQVVPDVRMDPEYMNVNPRTTSELVIPIRFHGEVLGVLNLESASPEVFSPASVLAFEAFADQVAGAIHLSSVNGRLAEATAQLELKTHALEDANAHLAHAIESMHRISTQDGLTGVANRRHFDETIPLEWRRSARSRAPLSFLMIDIDGFKAFNDTAGHQAGDDCLRRVATALRDTLHRAADHVARYGGDEFAVLLPETDAEAARHVAESLRARIEDLHIKHPSTPEGRVTVSIGVATAVPPRDGAGVEALVRRADDALYKAKRSGRNRVVSPESED